MDKLRGQSKADLIYEKIKLDLINRKYKVDDVLNEQHLADLYGVSKTPVREALSKLVEEGFLTKFPRFGYIVKDLKIADYYQIAQVRFVLECGVIKYIINNVPDEKISLLDEQVSKTYVPIEDYPQENRKFHLDLASLLENPYYYREIERILSWLNRDLARSFYEQVEGDVHINHRALVEALYARDEEKAIAVLNSELTRTDDNFDFAGNSSMLIQDADQKLKDDEL